jgi:Flp pilus assembly protein TadG
MHVPELSRRGRARRDDGTVTVETAAVIPPLLLMLVMGLSLVSTIHAQLLCVDAARAAARSASRGEAQDDVLAAATRLGPSGAAATVRREGSLVVVVVKATARPLTRFLPGIPVKAEAAVEAEDR